MNKKISVGVFAACLLASGIASAELNAVDQQYMDQLIKGGPQSSRQVAENMVNTGYTNTEVLDVMAQLVLDRYQLAGEEFTSVDSLAWMCRALGASHNNRYRPVLELVSKDKSVHRKGRGHCEKAAKQVPKGAENPYVAGTVNIENLRNPPPPPPPAPAAKGKKNAKAAKAAPAAAPAAAKAEPAAAAKAVDFGLVQVGMSSQQVSDLIGPPTNQTTRMTGKQFQPFNFGAKDLQRMNYLYKGVGRIEFSMKSGYEGVFRVIKVTPDPNETGYP
jgi:hypothetical protein